MSAAPAPPVAPPRPATPPDPPRPPRPPRPPGPHPVCPGQPRPGRPRLRFPRRRRAPADPPGPRVARRGRFLRRRSRPRRRHPAGVLRSADPLRSVGRRGSSQRGAVTAELAVGLPLLLAVTAGLAWLSAVAIGQIRTVDAARETARAVARGDDPAAAVAAGKRVAPAGVRISVTRSGDEVRVRATGRMAGPGGLFAALPGARLDAAAVALVEEGADDGGALPGPAAGGGP